MTPEDQASVQRTASIMADERAEFARRFYCRLFELHPSARELLPTDLQWQGGRLVDEIVYLAAATADMRRTSRSSLRSSGSAPAS